MKIILIANISANGKILLSDDPGHKLPKEAMDFYIRSAAKFGNLVIGSQTFKNFQKFPEDVKKIFDDIEIIVLSSDANISSSYRVVNRPIEAIDYLSKKGFKEVAIGGGTGTFNAFLFDGLVTDIYFNVSPIITGNGGDLGNQSKFDSKFKIAGSKVDSDYLQLHLTKN